MSVNLALYPFYGFSGFLLSVWAFDSGKAKDKLVFAVIDYRYDVGQGSAIAQFTARVGAQGVVAARDAPSRLLFLRD